MHYGVESMCSRWDTRHPVLCDNIAVASSPTKRISARLLLVYFSRISQMTSNVNSQWGSWHQTAICRTRLKLAVHRSWLLLHVPRTLLRELITFMFMMKVP
jgi:hypothetical protein